MDRPNRVIGRTVRSGTLRMFVTPAEVEDCLNDLRRERGLWLAAAVLSDKSVRTIGPADALQVQPPMDTIAVCDEEIGEFGISWSNFTWFPYQRGWLLLDLSLRDSSALIMATLGFKSAVVSAPELFRRVKRCFTRSLIRGVEVDDIRHEGSRRPVKDVYYSPGAKALAERGVIWKPDWSETTRYYPGS
jgi:hypothetical protein